MDTFPNLILLAKPHFTLMDMLSDTTAEYGELKISISILSMKNCNLPRSMIWHPIKEKSVPFSS